MHSRWIRIAVFGLVALTVAAAQRGTWAAVQAAGGPGAPIASDSQAAGARRAVAAVLHLTGAIGPATSHYVDRGLADAEARGDRLVILEIDTPGGLDTSMRQIIRVILASPVPVATFVAPSGARAASAAPCAGLP